MVPALTEYNYVEWIDGSNLRRTELRPLDDLGPRFLAYQKDADSIYGRDPRLRVVLQAREPLFHEAGVFVPSDDHDLLFVTSNILRDSEGTKHIKISKLIRHKEQAHWSHEDIAVDGLLMANGAVNMPGQKSILFCSQGDMTRPSSLVAMSIDEPHQVKSFLTNFHGRHFNSLNDVVIHSDGSVWFTDPAYGSEQGFKGLPDLPNQVYRYDPVKGNVRAMADGFGRPNGLCFSPDQQTLYVTDTDWIHGDGSTDGTRVSHIYAFTVAMLNGGTFLTNRRLFAMADCGAPDGIKCDTDGRVYSGCGDGLNIWAASGDLLGKILIPGGIANFCFGRPGELFLLNETMFWTADISSGIRGALLDGLDIRL